MPPDPWQADVLDSDDDRILLLCSRQSGKSTTAAALALREAITEAPALVLILSPTLRQSGELFRDKLLRLYNALPDPPPKAQLSATELTLANGSRIISLPESEQTIRGFSGVAMLVIDEASLVDDDLYRSVRPMLAVSRGKLVALSTPRGRRGWFYEEWISKKEWKRVKITAEQCPRISPEFLAEERLTLGDLWFRQEYYGDFTEVEGAEWPADYFHDGIWFDLWPSDIETRVMALDPSKGRDARTGDYSALVWLGRDSSGILWMDASLTRSDTNVITQQVIEASRRWRPDLVAIESNQFQELLVDEIARQSAETGVMVPVVPIDNRVNKLVRIRRLGPFLARNQIRFADTPGCRLLVQQLRDFPEGEHDDGPDAAEMAIRVLGDLLQGTFADEESIAVRPGE